MVRGYKVERITKLAKIHTRHVSTVQLFRENVCVEDDIYNQISNKASQAWKKGSPGSCRAGGGGASPRGTRAGKAVQCPSPKF